MTSVNTIADTSVPETSIGVKELVAFVWRRGDLVHDGVAGPTALEGMAAHKKIQSHKESSEQSEVSIATTLDCLGYKVKVRGRVDLLDLQHDKPIVTEIKSSYVEPHHVPEAVAQLHWSQLRIYAALLQHCEFKDQINSDDCLLRLSIINLRDEQIHTQEEHADWASLEKFLQSTLEQWVTWQKTVDAHRQRMRTSADSLEFPFPEFRDGQYQMAASVFRTLRDGQTLLCEAPTGIGKTVSALFPACKALAQQHVKQIAYLTAKTTGRQAASNALEKLHTAGLDASSLVIHSKALACHCKTGSCDYLPDGRCPRTIGFFDRLPAAREELMLRKHLDDRVLDEIGEKYDLCPFELSLQMIPWVEIIVCDYNYVFDPLVRLTAFAEHEGSIGFLIDEAHNLGDRSRSMYSAALDSRQHKEVKRVCKSALPQLARSADSINRSMSRVASSHDNLPAADDELPKALVKAVDRCLDVFAELDINGSSLDREKLATVWDWFKELYRFRVIAQLFGESHRVLIEVDGKGTKRHTSIRLICLDASDRLEKAFKNIHSAAVFSATLRPAQYHLNVLGLRNCENTVQLPSPYTVDQTGCFICNWVDTRYRAREDSAQNLTELIHLVRHAREGNYLVFFPSHAYMSQIVEHYQKMYPDEDIVVQQRITQTEDRQEYLDSFFNKRNALGFAITAGVFGEGIDYTGESLIGAIVVGTGLPGLSLQQSLLKDHFDAGGFNGFDYAFRYPGFTRVLQAAGRVIRSETDQGIVVLVDPRFNESFYRDLYPPQWNLTPCVDGNQLLQGLDQFWNKPA